MMSVFQRGVGMEYKGGSGRLRRVQLVHADKIVPVKDQVCFKQQIVYVHTLTLLVYYVQASLFPPILPYLFPWVYVKYLGRSVMFLDNGLRIIWDNSFHSCGFNRIRKTVSQCAFRPSYTQAVPLDVRTQMVVALGRLSMQGEYLYTRLLIDVHTRDISERPRFVPMILNRKEC